MQKSTFFNLDFLITLSLCSVYLGIIHVMWSIQTISYFAFSLLLHCFCPAGLCECYQEILYWQALHQV